MYVCGDVRMYVRRYVCMYAYVCMYVRTYIRIKKGSDGVRADLSYFSHYLRNKGSFMH